MSTYTKKFEDWVLRQLDYADNPPEMPPSIEMTYVEVRRHQAHFWLSAFARLVREEAAKEYHGDLPTPYAESVSNAFNAICELFNLKESE